MYVARPFWGDDDEEEDDEDEELEDMEDIPAPGTAVRERPTVANYVTDLSYQVETEDHQDHTFFGIMFDLEAKGNLPIENVILDGMRIRGDLGHVTVWWAPGGFEENKTNKAAWTQVYDALHRPSRREFAYLPIHAVTVKAGTKIGLYVHCRNSDDTALVYDNRRREIVYEDSFIEVHAGMAHLDNVPFGQRNPWGMGYGPNAAFRANRTFVGRLELGAKFMLWNPETHLKFPKKFREMVILMLMIARRPESGLIVQDETLFWIFNMCKYDWAETGGTPALNRRAAPRPVDMNKLRRWSGYHHVYEPPQRVAAPVPPEPTPLVAGMQDEEEMSGSDDDGGSWEEDGAGYYGMDPDQSSSDYGGSDDSASNLVEERTHAEQQAGDVLVAFLRHLETATPPSEGTPEPVQGTPPRNPVPASEGTVQPKEAPEEERPEPSAEQRKRADAPDEQPQVEPSGAPVKRRPDGEEGIVKGASTHSDKAGRKS
jgi:hypothetical protein